MRGRLTVREVVAMGRGPRKRFWEQDGPKDAARFAASRFASSPAASQRALVARALAQDPGPLCLDEPTNPQPPRRDLLTACTPCPRTRARRTSSTFPWMGNAWGIEWDWAGLEYGEPVIGKRLYVTRLEGLVWNSAAPDEILLRLLGFLPHLVRRRGVSDAVLDAAVDHPDAHVHEVLLESRIGRSMSADRWSRLLLGGSGGRGPVRALHVVRSSGIRLTDRTYEALAVDPSAQVREATAALPMLPARLRAALAADPAPRVRAAACENGWPELDAAARARLAADPVPAVRTAVTLAMHEEVPLTAEFLDAARGAMELVEGRRLERELAERLASDEAMGTRRSLAANPYLDPDLVAVLAADPEDAVRTAVSVRPELTEERRAAVARPPSPGARGLSPPGIRRDG